MTEAVLKVVGAHLQYGVVRALQDVTFEAARGHVTAVVGTNGAGKSTLMRAIAGLVQLNKGRIEGPDGADITRMPPDRRLTDLGLALVPEGRGIFHHMSVDENLAMGTRIGIRRHSEASAAEHLATLRRLFPILEQRHAQLAGTLSGGEQQILGISRALLAQPAVLLLDEPSMGLAPLVVERLFQTLAEYRKQNDLTVVLVEQDTELALELSDDAYLMEQGRVTLSGPSNEVSRSPALRETYLGVS